MFLGLDVDGDDFGGNSGGEFEGLFGDAVPTIDGNDDEGRCFVICGHDRGQAASGYGDLVIVKAYVAEKENQKRNEDRGEVGALFELRDQNNDNGDAGDECTEAVDEDAADPVRSTLFEPVPDHAGLRKGEGQKGANGVEGNQAFGDAAEKNKEKTGEQCQNNDAVGVDQAASTVSEDVRQIIVLGDGATEAGEIRERGIGGEGENQEDGGDGQIVESAFAKDGEQKHGKNALVAGPAGVGRDDAVGLQQIGSPGKQNGQNENDDGEGELSVLHTRFAKRLHAIADGFDTSESGTSTGEYFQEQPKRDGGGDWSGLRQRRNGDGMPVAEENANESRDDHDEQSAHEEISGNHEGSAGVVHSAQVENGDDQENSEAQRNRVWLQGRNRGNEGADSRGDANGGGEDVVGQQGRGCEKSRENAEVETRHGVRAATGWISADRLQVGKVNDDQQGDDGRADRDDVVDTQKTERDEDCESGFRAVRGGAEGVEAEDGDAGGGADLLRALVRGF